MNVPIIGTGMNMPSSESRCKNENKKKEPGKCKTEKIYLCEHDMSSLFYYEGLHLISYAKGMHKASVSGSRCNLLRKDNGFH